MKVVFVTHYTKMYGANRSLLNLLTGIRSKKIRPYVLSPAEGELTEHLSSEDINYYTLPFRKWMGRERWKAPARLAINLSSLIPLTIKVKEWSPDLIYTNTSVTPIGALLAEILSLPHIWHIREFGDLDYNLSYDWGEHNFYKLTSRSSAAIAVSHAVKNHILKEISIPKNVVYNGVASKEKMENISHTNIRSKDEYTFCIVGKLKEEKGQKDAIKAVKMVEERGKSVNLLVAGNSNEEHKAELKTLIDTLGLRKRVKLLGYVDDPFDVYKRSDALLMCSPNEAMGRVTAEAMAASLPVIGYNSAGTAELIDDGIDGLLYDGSIEGLSDKMIQLITSRELNNKLSKKAKRKALRMFTNEKYRNRVCEVIFNVHGNK